MSLLATFSTPSGTQRLPRAGGCAIILFENANISVASREECSYYGLSQMRNL